MYLLLGPNGEIEMLSSQPGEGLVFYPHRIEANIAHLYMADDELVERPIINPPIITGTVLTWTDLPPNCLVRIEDMEAFETLATITPENGTLTVSLPSGGIYDIYVTATTTPHMPFHMELRL